MSRVATIARDDLLRAVRERRLWGVGLVLVLWILPGIVATANPDLRPLSEYVLLTASDLRRGIVVVVAGVCYRSVLAERASGTVRLVMGAGTTRREFVLGKFLARAVTVTGFVLAALVVASVAARLNYGGWNLSLFSTAGSFTILYGLVWTAITVGYSAAFSSSYRVLAGVAVTYLVFNARYGFWDTFVRPAVTVLVAGTPSIPSYDVLPAAPLWVQLVQRANPLIDFWQAVRWSTGVVQSGSAAGSFEWQVVGVGVFLLFGAVPITVGIRRFDNGRIGVSGSDGGLLGPVRSRITAAGSAFPTPDTGRAGRWYTLVVYDIRHAVRGWTVPAVVVAAVVVAPDLVQTLRPGPANSVAELIAGLGWRFLIPVVVLGTAVGFRAVVGERQTGTVRLLLGQPVSRRTVLASKLVARALVTVATLLPLILVAELLVTVRFDSAHVVGFVAWTLWVVSVATVWTVFVVAVSAAVSSRVRSLAVVVLVSLFFFGLWTVVFPSPGRGPAWVRLVSVLNPIVALDFLREGVMTVAGYRTRFVQVTPVLFVLSLLSVLGELACPVAVGGYRFEWADLE